MTSIWKHDQELFGAARRELFSAVVGDVMDKLGLQRQFLPPRIQPLDRNMVVVGRAMPVIEQDIGPNDDGPPFGRMLEALDSLGRDEVYLCTGGSPRYALWGELMSVRARRCGAAGAVADGYTRDTLMIVEMGFPVLSFGSYAQDQGPRGKVVDFRVPVTIGEVRIDPGDIVFGDVDGVCIVPRSAEQDVFVGAFEKARGEKTARKSLEDGMTAQAVFERYGIL